MGTTYYVASYQPSSRFYPTFVCITALYMNTSVYIHTKKERMSVTLLQYESYRFDGRENEDLSGSLVQSDSPIVVISGVRTQVYKNASQTPVGSGLVVHLPPQIYGERLSALYPSKTQLLVAYTGCIR